MPPEKPDAESVQAEVEKPLVDPKITRSLGADYEALRNDLQQANEFASELQSELAANKNDAAHSRQLFEKTSVDLERLQESILALRRERHELANEVMKARSAEAKLGVAITERDESRAAVAELQQTIEKRDAQVADLSMQIVLLKNAFRQTHDRRVAEIAAKNNESIFIERFQS